MQLSFLRKSFQTFRAAFEPVLMEIDYTAIHGYPLVQLSQQ
jgi:hypothetical protein